MNYAIKHLFHIHVPKTKVFEAITTISGLRNWWTVETSGEAALGGIIQFRFSTNGGPDMKV
ncbi:MAG TPA: SRPBCC domain-containing protein, partial [Bacteroidia bacterium]|nr:SRPBCC domain-containing protein [Bacteroidia bacterium]